MCVGLMVQTNLKFTSNVLVHFMLFIFDNLYGFSTHGLQCHNLTWTLREGFSAFCWMEPACVAKFTLQSLSCRKPAVAGLKAWSNTSHYAFCSTWHITWHVANAEAQFLSLNMCLKMCLFSLISLGPTPVKAFRVNWWGLMWESFPLFFIFWVTHVQYTQVIWIRNHIVYSF